MFVFVYVVLHIVNCTYLGLVVFISRITVSAIYLCDSFLLCACLNCIILLI